MGTGRSSDPARGGWRIATRRIVVLALVLTALAPLARAAGADDAARSGAELRKRVALIRRWAAEGVYDRSVEARQRAVRDLNELIAIDPDDGELWMLLGHIYVTGEFDTQALKCFRRATVLDPRDGDAWLALGLAWKRDMFRRLDTLSAARAEGAFDTACLVRPRACEIWLALVPLRYERDDLAGALEAARRAMTLRRRNAEAVLAVAYLSYRVGDVEGSDALFREAIPRLRPDLRALLLDAPNWFRGEAEAEDRLTPAHGAMSAPDVVEAPAEDEPDVRGRASRAATMDSSAAFWKRLDPDPTTPENEMQLEYWSRVAHAYFLFWDPDRPNLDARAETYVRYGPPARVENNPLGVPLSYAPLRAGGDPHTKSFLDYPMHVQGWFYPDLGMRVVLDDRSLHGRFTPQVTREFDPLSVPSPAVLARRGDLLAIGGGAAVFPTLAPRSQRIEVRGTVLRFEGAHGPRLLVQVRAAGAPDDSLSARWIVLDRDDRELTGSDVKLGVSSCDPTSWRLAEVAAELPAGAASVALSVRDTHHRRGLFRARTELTPPPRTLAMSDVVLCCGDPSRYAHAGLVQFEADMDHRVSGREPMVAYFELYRLTTGADGLARFAYTYRVLQLATADGRKTRGHEPPEVLSSSREETNVGALRRQFVTVPLTSLAPGRYRLVVDVRDLVAGAETEGSAEFDRE